MARPDPKPAAAAAKPTRAEKTLAASSPAKATAKPAVNRPAAAWGDSEITAGIADLREAIADMSAASRRHAEQVEHALKARPSRPPTAAVVSTQVRAYAVVACVLVVALLLAWLGWLYFTTPSAGT